MKKIFLLLFCLFFIASISYAQPTLDGGLGVLGIWEDLSLSGDLAVGDDLTVTDDATIGGELDIDGNATIGGDLDVTGNISAATYETSITAAELLTIDDGDTTEIPVGGGAGSAMVWTTATGTGAPVRAGSPTFTTQITTPKVENAAAVTIESTGAGVNIDIHSDAGDDFAVDTSKLVVEGDTGQVGIGTATPAAQLDIEIGTAARKGLQIKGAASASEDLIHVKNSGDTEFFAVGPAGNVDIAQNLDVDGDVDMGSLNIKTTNPGMVNFINCAVDSNSVDGTSHGYIIPVDGVEVMRLWADSNGYGTVNDAVVKITGNFYATTYGSDGSITDAELKVIDDGTTSQMLVGGGAGSIPVWGTAIPDGVTATTQSSSDNSTKIATTAYADAAAGSGAVESFELTDPNSVTNYITVSAYTTAGINAAIDALGAPGGEVFLPAGTYVCTDGTITIDTAGTVLTGAGCGTTILDFSAGQGGNPSCIDTNDKNNVTIRGIKMVGNPGGGESICFIGDNDDADYLTVSNCWFVDCDYRAIYTSGKYALIENNIFDNNDNMDIYLYDDYSIARNNTILNAGDGASVYSFACTADYCQITNNEISTVFGVAIALTSSTPHSNLISGNIIKGAGKGAIRLYSDSSYNVVTNNIIYDTTSGYADILIEEDYNIISDNQCYGDGAGDYGIHLDEADYCLISNNLSSGHDVAGIQEESDCQNNTVNDNKVLDSTPYVIAGTSHDNLSIDGEMYKTENATDVTIETANTPIMCRGFTEGVTEHLTYTAGSTGEITAFADYSGTVAGTVLVTDVGHGLATGDIISIRGTTNYNDVFSITYVDPNTFYITDTWAADDGASDWDEGDYFTIVFPGIYACHYDTTLACDGAQEMHLTVYINTTDQTKATVGQEFAINDLGTMGGSGFLTLVAGDRVSLVAEADDTNIYNMKHANFTIGKL